LGPGAGAPPPPPPPPPARPRPGGPRGGGGAPPPTSACIVGCPSGGGIDPGQIPRCWVQDDLKDLTTYGYCIKDDKPTGNGEETLPYGVQMVRGGWGGSGTRHWHRPWTPPHCYTLPSPP